MENVTSNTTAGRGRPKGKTSKVVAALSKENNMQKLEAAEAALTTHLVQPFLKTEGGDDENDVAAAGMDVVEDDSDVTVSEAESLSEMDELVEDADEEQFPNTEFDQGQQQQQQEEEENNNGNDNEEEEEDEAISASTGLERQGMSTRRRRASAEKSFSLQESGAAASKKRSFSTSVDGEGGGKGKGGGSKKKSSANHSRKVSEENPEILLNRELLSLELERKKKELYFYEMHEKLRLQKAQKQVDFNSTQEKLLLVVARQKMIDAGISGEIIQASIPSKYQLPPISYPASSVTTALEASNSVVGTGSQRSSLAKKTARILGEVFVEGDSMEFTLEDGTPVSNRQLFEPQKEKEKKRRLSKKSGKNLVEVAIPAPVVESIPPPAPVVVALPPAPVFDRPPPRERPVKTEQPMLLRTYFPAEETMEMAEFMQCLRRDYNGSLMYKSPELIEALNPTNLVEVSFKSVSKALKGRNLKALLHDYAIADGDADAVVNEIETRLKKPLKQNHKVWDTIVNAGYTDLVECIVDRKIEFDEDVDYSLLLTKNARTGNLEICQILLDLGADPNIPSKPKDGDYSLQIAAFEDHLDICQLLVKYGADVNSFKKPLWTPLTNAVHEGHVEVSQFLIEQGAELDVVLANNWRPITIAVIKGHLKIVQILCDLGVPFDVLTKDGKNLLEISVEKEHKKIARYLRDLKDPRSHAYQNLGKAAKSSKLKSIEVDDTAPASSSIVAGEVAVAAEGTAEAEAMVEAEVMVEAEGMVEAEDLPVADAEVDADIPVGAPSPDISSDDDDAQAEAQVENSNESSSSLIVENMEVGEQEASNVDSVLDSIQKSAANYDHPSLRITSLSVDQAMLNTTDIDDCWDEEKQVKEVEMVAEDLVKDEGKEDVDDEQME